MTKNGNIREKAHCTKGDEILISKIIQYENINFVAHLGDQKPSGLPTKGITYV